MKIRLARLRYCALATAFALVVGVVAAGCGGGGTSGGGGGGSGSGPTLAPRGTYNLTITATSGNLVHSAVLTYTVQ